MHMPALLKGLERKARFYLYEELTTLLLSVVGIAKSF